MKHPSPLPLPQYTPCVLVVSLDHHLGNTVVQLPVIAALARYFTYGIDLLPDDRYLALAAALPLDQRPV